MPFVKHYYSDKFKMKESGTCSGVPRNFVRGVGGGVVNKFS